MKQPKIQFYKGADNKWRWRMVASNGRVICTPGESFSSRAKAVHNLNCLTDVIFNGYATYYLR